MPASADSMYKCEICGHVPPPRTSAHKVILQTRPVFYPARPKVNTCWKWKGDRRKFVRTDDPGGTGRECVQEVTACAACASKFAEHPNRSSTRAPKSQSRLKRLA